MDNTSISVIIPTISGREDHLAECLAAYKSTSPPDTEYIVIKDEPSCGHAWQKGAHQSVGRYVHFTADDLIPHQGWWEDAKAIINEGGVPAAHVLNRRGELSVCDSPLGAMGHHRNPLVPFLSQPQLDAGGWLLPLHYGSDDWVAYRAVQLGMPIIAVDSYRFTHMVADHGRNYLRRHGDVKMLADAMEQAGYLPPVYRELEFRLRTSETGLDSVSLAQLQEKQAMGKDGRTIYTASQFKNEVDVLEIRLETIGDLVDRIVLAEATVDQRGRHKELNFPRHASRFGKWADKIEYVVVDDMPTGGTHSDDVKRERHQRECLIRGMPNLRPQDLVYVSDLDEIPTPEALKDGIADPPMRFGMDLHPYALNWRWLDRGCRAATLGAVIKGSDILENGICWSVLSDKRVVQRPGISGWHLHNMGGVAFMRDKIEGMMDKAHDLMPLEWHGTPPDGFMSDEWIADCIATGKDVFGRVAFRPTEWVGIDEMPFAVFSDPSKYAHLMVPKPPKQDLLEAMVRCTCGAIYHGDVLYHFPYCAMAAVEGTPIHVADDRGTPRAS